MAKQKPIEHVGVVEAIEDDKILVKIVAESACASCAARSACGMSESTDKQIEVHTREAASYAVGERCVVSVERAAGLKAVVLAYCMPLLVMLVVLVACSAAGLSDGVAAVAALGVVAAYYFVVRLLRSKIETNIIFKIKKQ
ncbi:MAG: SoxR reducing system RseC family protein [Rikenellaceae bacterium]|nr:SoxR reducing system RseC family protein [Rikenellaceae bacterium]